MNAPFREKITWDPKLKDWRPATMTLDHTTQEIIPDPQKLKEMDILQAVKDQNLPAPFNLEDTSMVREFAARISNMIVDASQVAVDVKALRAEMDSLRNALAVANEQARRAIEERDQARASETIAIKQREMADKAYETVNTQRIEAERQLVEEMLKAEQMTQSYKTACSDLDFRASELDQLNNLLSIADREREEWRSKWDHERDRADLAELERDDRIKGHDEAKEEVKRLLNANGHLVTDLDRHRSTLLDASTSISYLEAELEASKLEAEVLRERTTSLETTNQNVHHHNREMLEQITAARRVLNHHHDALKVLD